MDCCFLPRWDELSCVASDGDAGKNDCGPYLDACSILTRMPPPAGLSGDEDGAFGDDPTDDEDEDGLDDDEDWDEDDDDVEVGSRNPSKADDDADLVDAACHVANVKTPDGPAECSDLC